MDYEKLYKKALERASKLRFQNPFDTVSQMMEHVFPELAESEDERIRKEIISHLQHEYVVKRYVSDVEYDRWIAWLEKQGQQKYIPKYKIGDYVKNTNYKGEPIYEIIYMDKECYICEYRGKEEMGDKTVMHFSFDNPYLRLVQKPVDKVEPKFHEGEWIIDGQGFTHQIERVVENVTTHTFGYDIVGGGYFNEDNKNIHLWTIQDAKDGDVLSSGHLVFIFKVIHGVWLNCHCSAHNDGSFIADSYDLMINKYFSEVHPATKEQRDLLFAKMRDAGYEWNDEKKKLKKIEPHNSDEVEAKFQVGDWIVNKFGDSWHIDSFDKKNYQVSDGKGNYNWFPISKQDEMHYWTIKDAKDGDALVTYDIRDNIEWLFLYKPNKHKLHINDPRFYCHYDIKTDSFKKDTDYVSLALGTKFRPTTKEQRDTLFSKMKEEGFEWDKTKKELRKIEQKSKWTDEDEERLQSCIIALQGKGLMGGVDTINTKWLKSLKQRLEQR